MWTPGTALLLFSGVAINSPPGAIPSLISTAQEPAAEPAQTDLRAQFLGLEDEYDAARSAFYATLSAAWEKHEAEGGDGSEFKFPDPIEPTFYPKFQALADAGYTDANGWCLANHAHSGLEGVEAREDKSRRMTALLEGGPSEEMLQSAAGVLMNECFPSPYGLDEKSILGAEAAFGYLDRIREAAKTDDVKAFTLYARGMALQNAIDGSEEGAKRRTQADEWLARAASEYPETETGLRAGGLLFAANNLQIGQVAPDIVGKDHDGNEIARSDFAGKVTVLDFWGFW